MPCRKSYFAPTASQVLMAERLRSVIASTDFGYDIKLPLAYGSTPFDFLAVHRQAPTRIVAVLLLKNGAVSVRPFNAWGQRNSLLHAILFETKRCCKMRAWNKRCLPKDPLQPGGWEHLVTG